MRKFLFDKSMRRFYFLILLFLVSHTFVFSQGRKHNFLIGYNVALDSFTSATKARLTIDSNSIGVMPETRKMPFDATQGNISDENGNLLMVSNGCWIANSTGDTMMNGCCLNPGLFTSDWCDNTTGLPLAHGNIILPFPGDTTKYVLFHQTGDYNNTLAEPSKLYYSVIDMTLDGGLGGVTLKNQIAFQDTLSTGIAACKHANGRDWWIVALKDNSNIIYKILLTPSGISSVTTQILNVPFAYYNAAEPTFSPDGNKFAYTAGSNGTIPWHDVRLFNFDRCTGNFSDTTYILFNDSLTGFGLAFSSNSKYLYKSNFHKIYQINTDTNNITVNGVVLVAINDGYYSPYPPLQTDFWWMYLAANGKIYVSSGNSVVDLHYINYPDSADTLCDVHQHALHLPCYSGRANVNHPNYYLGCDTTSGCSCLATGIDAIVQHNFHLSLFPNPNNGVFNISYLLPQNKGGTLEVFDVMGNCIYKMNLPEWSTMQQIELPHIAEGLYNCVITSGVKTVSKTVAVVKE